MEQTDNGLNVTWFIAQHENAEGKATGKRFANMSEKEAIGKLSGLKNPYKLIYGYEVPVCEKSDLN